MMAKLKEIKASLGISLERDGVWYRPNCEVTLEIDETDTPVKRKAIWSKAWETVVEQVEKQINEITNR